MIIEKNPPMDSYRCIFCCLAPAEMSFSLRVLSNPTEYPTYSDWAKRKFDSLSSNLRQEIEFFNDKYQWYFITDTVVYLMGEEETSIDNINILLSRLENIDVITFAYIFLGFSAYYSYSSCYEKIEGWFKNPNNISMEEMGPDAKYFHLEDIVYFFKNNNEVKRRLIHLYQQYWIEMFHKEWASIREYEYEAIRHQRLIFQHDDPIHYISTLHPDLVVKDDKIIFQKEPSFEMKIKDLKKLVIKPSIFVGSTLSGNIVNDKMTITLNLNFHLVKTSNPIASKTTDIISALNDSTRLRIIKVLWNCDATTKELSEIINVSASTISLHLKQLKEAELVTTKKVKKYVYYQLRKDRFYGIEKRIVQYLNY